MKRITFILLLIICLLPFSFSTTVSAKMQSEQGIDDEIIDEGPLSPKREEEAPPEEEYIEEEPPEELEPVIPTQRQKRPAVKPSPPVEGGEAREGEELRQVVIDSLVNLNYVFNNSSDSFVLKYHLHLDGKIAAATAVIKGKASIATEVTGFLAKWPTGECKLSVTIPDSPFELSFSKSGEDKAMINLKFPSPIVETWESQCSFKDAPDAKFNTKGDPEKWFVKALEKARPPLSRITVSLTPEESTTMKFEISKQTIKDQPLGSAELEGTGVVTVNPGNGE